jgi:uncharacterized RDD family membrane protein YckC
MPETIFGASLIEAALLITALIVICRAVKRTVGQTTDIAMDMAPWVAGLFLLAVVLFAGLWLYRQGQWSMQ